MKKLRMAVLAAIVAMIGMVVFAACGSSQAGVYKFYSMTMEENGLKTEYFVGDEILANTKLTEDFAKYELTENGTCILTVYGETRTGTWVRNQEDSKKVDLTVDGNTITVFCDGKTIKYTTDEGLSYVLKK